MKFFMIFLSSVFYVIAEELPKESPYSFYFYLQGGGGKMETKAETGKTDTGKAGLEYRPFPFLGIGLSYSESSSGLKAKSNPLDYIIPYYLIQSELSRGQDASRSILFYSLIDSVNSRRVFNFHYNSGAVDLNFHLNGDSTFDPYIGFSFFGGSCIGKDTKCDVKGGEGRLGIQFNIDSFFFYIQVQRQQTAFSGNGKIDAVSDLGSAGLGVRF